MILLNWECEQMSLPDRRINLEEKRISLQSQLDSAKAAAERNLLGQFATPSKLAREILAYARDHIALSGPIRFLDPAIGTGSFYSALLEEFESALIERAIGYEIDPHYGEPARQLWADTPLEVRLADFTRARPQDPSEKATLLICNPPYVRHHHINPDDKKYLTAATFKASGMRLSGLAGLYCHFLGLAHAWMAEGALAGWLIPSEFMDVNYGSEVKRYLLERVTLTHIHRFDPDDAQFDDALVSSAIVWLVNTPPHDDHEITFSYGGTLAQPQFVGRVRRSVLATLRKWTRLPRFSVDHEHSDDGTRLGCHFTIRRGIASGSNEFFILTPGQIAAHDLPWEFFRPILPSPRYLYDNEVMADARGWPVLDEQLFLLDCRLPEAEVREHYPTLWRYLQRGVESGVSTTYLARHRSPWYAQEHRPAAPIVCTYMGRNGTRHGRPIRFILNHSQATAANGYLMLYPKPPLATLARDDPSLLRRIWEELNTIEVERLLTEGRVYGGGLYKLEPRELANVNLSVLDELTRSLRRRWYQTSLVYG
ncbi:MAG: hypothetical protein KatS3mg059_0191 [Thermomicrobiales bacterium]|nr:MAG: hypothetical protein KatS3mg059_0191 [Thermomicrobiales bacterium]